MSDSVHHFINIWLNDIKQVLGPIQLSGRNKQRNNWKLSSKPQYHSCKMILSKLHLTSLWCEIVRAQTKILTLNHSAPVIPNRRVVLESPLALKHWKYQAYTQRDRSSRVEHYLLTPPSCSHLSFVHFAKCMYQFVILSTHDYYLFFPPPYILWTTFLTHINASKKETWKFPDGPMVRTLLLLYS